MKSTIKRGLFAGMALGLAALTARRFNRDHEIEASVDGNTAGKLEDPQQNKAPLPPPRGTGGQATPPTPEAIGNSAAPPSTNGQTAPAAPTHSPTVSVTFSGTVVRKGSHLALRETAGVLYPLDGDPRARTFEGADVRVTGKIDLSTRMLHVDAIESAVL